MQIEKQTRLLQLQVALWWAVLQEVSVLYEDSNYGDLTVKTKLH